jgi:glutamyl-tRNA synthetase
MRIIDSKRYPHPRVGSKYHAWPLYNLAAGIDDHLLGITHIIRGKEHLTNGVRQEFMYRHLGWEYPEAIHYGRLKITGAFLSKSKIVAGVRSGEFCGWDDPRLATFAALRRRGIMAEAIKKMIIDVGPRPVDATLSWENLYSLNRKIIDPQSERYFFVADPIRLEVKGIPQIFTAELPLHPDQKESGFRKYMVKPSADCKSANFWIARKDAANMEKGKIIRLMELFNVKIEVARPDVVEAVFSSESYEDVRKIKAPLIQWISVGQEYLSRVVNQDASIVEGYAEGACKKLKPDAVIQFERFGFVRADSVAEKLTVYYSHK